MSHLDAKRGHNLGRGSLAWLLISWDWDWQLSAQERRARSWLKTTTERNWFVLSQAWPGAGCWPSVRWEDEPRPQRWWLRHQILGQSLHNDYPNIYDKDYPQVTAWCHAELSPPPSLDITVKTHWWEILRQDTQLDNIIRAEERDRKTSEFEVIIDNVTLNLAPAQKISEAKHFLGKYPHFIHTALSKALHWKRKRELGTKL